MKQVKLKAGDLLRVQPVIEKISEWQVSGKIALRLRREVKKIKEELTTIEEVRSDLIKKYGTQNKQGSIEVVPGTDEFTSFVEDFNQVLESEITLNMEPVFTGDDLPETDLKTIDALIETGLLLEE